MNIFFIGTVQFSKIMLEKLIEMNASVVGVATMESSPFNSDFSDLTGICSKNNIPFRYTTDINALEMVQWIQQTGADIIFCFGWSRLLRKELLQSTKMGVIGFHPAALPANRGRHPLIWAMVLGLTETASTFFFMDEGADSGDILSQKPISIAYEDDATTLYEKVTSVALDQLQEFLPLLQKNTFRRMKQDDSLANAWRKRGKSDGKIDWRMNSRAIYNLVRALTKPYVGAHMEYKATEFKVYKVKEVEYFCQNIEPGKVVANTEKTFTVKTADTAVEVLEHELPRLPKVNEYL